VDLEYNTGCSWGSYEMKMRTYFHASFAGRKEVVVWMLAVSLSESVVIVFAARRPLRFLKIILFLFFFFFFVFARASC
jgi:hypothetical protein